jgi:hypothetical protein
MLKTREVVVEANARDCTSGVMRGAKNYHTRILSDQRRLMVRVFYHLVLIRVKGKHLYIYGLYPKKREIEL